MRNELAYERYTKRHIASNIVDQEFMISKIDEFSSDLLDFDIINFNEKRKLVMKVINVDGKLFFDCRWWIRYGKLVKFFPMTQGITIDFNRLRSDIIASIDDMCRVSNEYIGNNNVTESPKPLINKDNHNPPDVT